MSLTAVLTQWARVPEFPARSSCSTWDSRLLTANEEKVKSSFSVTSNLLLSGTEKSLVTWFPVWLDPSTRRDVPSLEPFFLVLVLILGSSSFWVLVWLPESPRLTKNRVLLPPRLQLRCQVPRPFALTRPHALLSESLFWEGQEYSYWQELSTDERPARDVRCGGCKSQRHRWEESGGRHSGQAGLRSRDRGRTADVEKLRTWLTGGSRTWTQVFWKWTTLTYQHATLLS